MYSFTKKKEILRVLGNPEKWEKRVTDLAEIQGNRGRVTLGNIALFFQRSGVPQIVAMQKRGSASVTFIREGLKGTFVDESGSSVIVNFGNNDIDKYSLKESEKIVPRSETSDIRPHSDPFPVPDRDIRIAFTPDGAKVVLVEECNAAILFARPDWRLPKPGLKTIFGYVIRLPISAGDYALKEMIARDLGVFPSFQTSTGLATAYENLSREALKKSFQNEDSISQFALEYDGDFLLATGGETRRQIFNGSFVATEIIKRFSERPLILNEMPDYKSLPLLLQNKGDTARDSLGRLWNGLIISSPNIPAYIVAARDTFANVFKVPGDEFLAFQLNGNFGLIAANADSLARAVPQKSAPMPYGLEDQVDCFRNYGELEMKI